VMGGGGEHGSHAQATPKCRVKSSWQSPPKESFDETDPVACSDSEDKKLPPFDIQQIYNILVS